MKYCLNSRNVFCAILLMLWPLTVIAEQNRPSVGLVLAGGGARGIAHVGVIKALEELQIPVDAVAGTSMGALVGGLYASGRGVDELGTIVQTMDWQRAFEDRVPRSQLSQRRKSDDFGYPAEVQMSIKDGDITFPLGVVQGQQVRQMIKELMLPVADISDFDLLPTPFRAVATDIETGQAYVFSEGDIVTALRASMSLPGLLAPVPHENLLLVDGGMANNIPVDVARQMGADRLIVVDIGTPLKKRAEITSLLSVADQVLGFLTRTNSLGQLSLMADSDVLVRPDLQGVGMLDFDQQQTIMDSGYRATMALADQLAPLRLAAQPWRAYLASRQPRTPLSPEINFLVVDNNSAITDEMIEVYISQPMGELLDRALLLDDIATIYALDYWESIDYEVVERDGQTGLLLRAKEKSWGGDRLSIGLNLLTDLEGSSDITVGSSYLWKGLNSKAAELYVRGQLGDVVSLSGEFYQPLDLRSRFFVAPYMGYKDYQVLSVGPEYDVDVIVGAWRVRDFTAELSVGANVSTGSQLRAGVFRGLGEYREDVAVTDSLPTGSYDEAGAYVSYRLDNVDNLFLPTSGVIAYLEYEQYLRDWGADKDFERLLVFGQGAFSFGHELRNTVLFTTKLGQTWSASNEPQNYFQLGGLFNSSGLAQDFYSGRQMGFLMARYQRKLSDDSVIPLNMPIYAGVSLEGGQLWSHRDEMDFGDLLVSGSLYLAIDSPLGPIHLAYGRTEESQDAIYLSLGWPFSAGGNRLRR
jgi:NTE family protein